MLPILAPTAAHVAKSTIVAVASTAVVVGQVATDAFGPESWPWLGLGAAGFAALVWRLLRDDRWERKVRADYAELLEESKRQTAAERARAERAEAAARAASDDLIKANRKLDHADERIVSLLRDRAQLQARLDLRDGA